MVKDIGHFIGGKHVKGTSGRFADIYNPNTGEVQARVALASAAELRAAVENAKAAQPDLPARSDLFASFERIFSGDADAKMREFAAGALASFPESSRASDLLVAVFGDAGKHARASVGVNALPAGAAVEVDLIAEVTD